MNTRCYWLASRPVSLMLALAMHFKCFTRAYALASHSGLSSCSGLISRVVLVSCAGLALHTEGFMLGCKFALFSVSSNRNHAGCQIASHCAVLTQVLSLRFNFFIRGCRLALRSGFRLNLALYVRFFGCRSHFLCVTHLALQGTKYMH